MFSCWGPNGPQTQSCSLTIGLGSVWSNPRERWSANAEVLSAGGSSRWMLLPHQPSDNGRFVQSKIGGSAPLIEMLA